MHELRLLLSGILAGLAIAVPVGPVNVLCMQRTLAAGWRAGIVSGFGAAVADMLYGTVAGFSITIIIRFLIAEIFWIRLLGGILLIAIGIVYYFKRVEILIDATPDSPAAWSEFRTVFLVTLANPTSVLSFLAVLAALGMGERRPWWMTLFLVFGIFLGSMTWWIVLSAIVSRFRNRFTGRILIWMNRIAGLAIGALGIAQLALSRAGH